MSCPDLTVKYSVGIGMNIFKIIFFRKWRRSRLKRDFFYFMIYQFVIKRLIFSLSDRPLALIAHLHSQFNHVLHC